MGVEGLLANVVFVGMTFDLQTKFAHFVEPPFGTCRSSVTRMDDTARLVVELREPARAAHGELKPVGRATRPLNDAIGGKERLQAVFTEDVVGGALGGAVSTSSTPTTSATEQQTENRG